MMLLLLLSMLIVRRLGRGMVVCVFLDRLTIECRKMVNVDVL